MRRLVRGLTLVGLTAGVCYAVFTFTRLAKDTSSDQSNDYTPTPATRKPTPDESDQPEQPKPSDEPERPPVPRPSSNEWPLAPEK